LWTKIIGVQAKLTLRPGIKLVFLKGRVISFKLIPLVDKMIDILGKVGMLTKTKTAEWAILIVPILKVDDSV